MRGGIKQYLSAKEENPLKGGIGIFRNTAGCDNYCQCRLLVGGAFFSQIKDTALQGQLSKQELGEMKNIAFRAVLCDPLESRYWYAMANIEWLMSERVPALQHYTMAVDLNPTSGEYLQRLGLSNRNSAP